MGFQPSHKQPKVRENFLCPCMSDDGDGSALLGVCLIPQCGGMGAASGEGGCSEQRQGEGGRLDMSMAHGVLK